jgi:hypothetical protein
MNKRTVYVERVKGSWEAVYLAENAHNDGHDHLFYAYAADKRAAVQELCQKLNFSQRHVEVREIGKKQRRLVDWLWWRKKYKRLYALLEEIARAKALELRPYRDCNWPKNAGELELMASVLPRKHYTEYVTGEAAAICALSKRYAVGPLAVFLGRVSEGRLHQDFFVRCVNRSAERAR